ncbi:coenzyme F420-reducing hydrogenase, FrhD protein [Methanobrevibacter millerae]|uniref:Coenzyme F420 hydrogenase delta subunit FrhD1 n=1 Tax=Methanobrevibacter millerae TaxID=230361 RepID=A0A0U3CQU5_9EURY|nr:coenzyme F420-reducing hydrogenase, FrhD protein [Methanobrevibacter millerae]ALT67999.1 coenzyme F420 hydrogenase delta subunit FrhD1 [Methanobrevibacter millerae]MBO6110016.1 coenzyme F420-reducing hydrogenase, FrhD protein [Methanobrevibacter sp.]MBO6275051.1 coenzyme F420-reducing hydrogenase, FrhD protein [Methanobrevibacter sp.]
MPYHAKTIVVGCGNLLFKDDGFGPIVVNLLEKYFENQTEDDFDPMVISYIENDFSKDVLKEVEDIVCDVDLSGEVKFIDAGNGATHFIFSLPDEYWEKVIVVDVVDYDAEPGSVRTFSPFEMPRDKYENVHTYAVEEPLHELSEKCEVVIVGCKPGEITTPTVDMGLTEEVEKSVPDAIRLILNEIK